MQEKQTLIGRANGARVRRMGDEERLTDTIPAFRISDDVSRVIRGIVKADRRTISDVVRALLERGVAAYQRDGKLFEPPASNGSENGDASAEPEQPSTVRVARKKLGKQGGDKKRETA